MKIKKNCLNCKKEFVTWSCHIKIGGGKYCSQKCSSISRITRIKKKCLQCNKKFEVLFSRIKNGGVKYCSLKCSGLSQRTKVKTNCISCDKEFEIWSSRIKMGKGKLCSVKCQTIARRTRIKRKCLICNKEFEVCPSHIKIGKGKLCGIKCRELYLVGENTSGWKGGISFEPYTLDFTKRLKEAVRKRDNYCCQVCNRLEEDLKRKLHIHHIDYNKKNSFPQNLISLCTRCHMITNHNRTHWKIFFQSLLKERQGYEYTSEQKIVFDFIKD